MGRWWVAVIALLVGVGAGFSLGRATDSGTPKRTVDASRTFINAPQGESGNWTTNAVRRACSSEDVAVVRVTITQVTVGGHGAWSFTKTKPYKCEAVMQQFKK